MANFSTPFALTGPRRNPTTDERSNGFPCGPADQLLFNGLFHRIESELGNVITHAGLTPSDASFSQVKDAIVALIAAATGGGATESYLLMDQARARLPIYPEVVSTDGKINLTAPVTGTVRVPSDVDIVHRGIFTVTTAQTDFNTLANRTYHLRWNPTDGLVLKDLSDGTYNPTALAETDLIFDSDYDDMLIARVVTNSSNVATITSLANKHRLFAQGQAQSIANAWQNVNDIAGITSYSVKTVNFSRTPRSTMPYGLNLTLDVAGSALSGEANQGVKTLSRYEVGVFWQRSSTPGTSTIGWQAEA